MNYLICYDIANRKRLQKIAKTKVEKKSIFIGKLAGVKSAGNSRFFYLLYNSIQQR